MIALILYLIALACFILAAVGVGSRVNLVAAGLALWLFTAVILPHFA